MVTGRRNGSQAKELYGEAIRNQAVHYYRDVTFLSLKVSWRSDGTTMSLGSGSSWKGQQDEDG